MSAPVHAGEGTDAPAHVRGAHLPDYLVDIGLDMATKAATDDGTPVVRTGIDGVRVTVTSVIDNMGRRRWDVEHGGGSASAFTAADAAETVAEVIARGPRPVSAPPPAVSSSAPARAPEPLSPMAQAEEAWGRACSKPRMVLSAQASADITACLAAHGLEATLEAIAEIGGESHRSPSTKWIADRIRRIAERAAAPQANGVRKRGANPADPIPMDREMWARHPNGWGD